VQKFTSLGVGCLCLFDYIGIAEPREANKHNITV